MGSSGVNRRGTWLRLALVQPGAELGEGLAHRPEVRFDVRQRDEPLVRPKGYGTGQLPVFPVIVIMPVGRAFVDDAVELEVGDEVSS